MTSYHPYVRMEETLQRGEIGECDPPEVHAALAAHERAAAVGAELAEMLYLAAGGDTEALEWVRAREEEHAAAARALHDVALAAERANLIAVADAAPIVGIDLVTLMRRIEARGVSYSLPRGSRGPLYLRIEDLDRLR